MRNNIVITAKDTEGDIIYLELHPDTPLCSDTCDGLLDRLECILKFLGYGGVELNHNT